MKLLCFGSCNMDLVYAVDQMVQPGETICASGLDTFPGGKGLNQAIALAKAGAYVYFAGCIGKDGQMLYDTMSASGVDLRYLRTVPGKTGHAVIQVNQDGENAIIIFAGANGEVSVPYIESVLADFSEGDILLVQNEISNLSRLVDIAAEKGMKVFFNPSPYNEDVKAIDLKNIQYLIVNETEAEAMTGSREPDALQQFIRERHPHLTIVMTRGKQGSTLYTADTVIQQCAYRTQTVDTTAAGDTYTGYLIAALSQGEAPKAAMAYAATASSIAVSRKGASVSIPTREEVLERTNKLEPYSAPSSGQVRKAKAYLQTHYADGSLHALSQELGFSPAYTSSWIKKNLGASFTELIHDRRCEVCAMYLRTTELSVGEIIERVGYENESFFRRKFAKKYGCSPLHYRNRKDGNA